MADVRDEHGNPIELTDEHGNPVELTDEYGNPMQLKGVATVASGDHTPPAAAATSVVGEEKDDMCGETKESGGDIKVGDEVTVAAVGVGDAGAVMHGKVVEEKTTPLGEEQHHHQLSTSSTSSSSEEDDGQGGRRKKKGITAKIKEKFGSRKHKEKDQHPHDSTATTGVTTTGAHVDHHEKKSVIEKIKEKLPGHHTSTTSP